MPRRKPCSSTVALLCWFGITQAGLLLMPVVASARECASLPAESEARDLAIADLAGRAIVFPDYGAHGVAPTVRCFTRQLDVDLHHLPDGIDSISVGLLSIMTIDPQRFFRELANAPARAVSNWLFEGLPMAEIQYENDCPQPDRFEQARKALAGFHPSQGAERDLVKRVEAALLPRKCRIP